MKNRRLDDRTVQAIRVLSIEGVEKARSGHPGLPLGAAPMAYELWAHHMKHNPKKPDWLNRDRFVLSAGHGSMLLYSLLYLFGYGTTKEDLMAFRQWDSKTPGHPEYGLTVGVETTTGPLGQGFATACGMAMAEAHLAAILNTPERKIIDHRTYVLCGDGDLMEGISSEAASLAGTLKLGKLIVLYDDNAISIEGSTDLAFTEDVGHRFEAYGWHVLQVSDGNDRDAISRALDEAKTRDDRPSLIRIKTKIGYASPVEGSAAAHGAPLGGDNVTTTKKALGWPEDLDAFEVPEDILAYTESLVTELEKDETLWREAFSLWENENPKLAGAFKKARSKTDLDDLTLDELLALSSKDEATRVTSGRVLNYIAHKTDFMFGGSADLAPSNNTKIDGALSFSQTTPEGPMIHFGVREFAMAAIGNGIALHGALRPYVATFLVFSDYLKGSIRLSALMNVPLIYILTHDSIAVGEDGPTHQPIEQLTMLRAIPNLTVFRPAGKDETTAAWYQALQNEGPTVLALSRQSIASDETKPEEVARGAYIVRDVKAPDVLIMASGSELPPALKAASLLEEEGIRARVVSMVSMELFEQQSAEYKEQLLPQALRKRVAVEAASPIPWYRYTGLDGLVIGMDHFGASAPGQRVLDEFGFTPENIKEKIKQLLKA